MNNLKKIYIGLRELVSPSTPNTPIKSNYPTKNVFLIKNCILKPFFKDEFNIGKSIKYNKLFQTIPIIYQMTNDKQYNTCKKIEKDELQYANFKQTKNNDNNSNDDMEQYMNDLLNSKIVIGVLFVNLIILYKLFKK
jgi:hypothetical protein